MAAVASQPLELVARKDLVVEPVDFRGDRYWNIKDPIALRYYQLSDEERFILEQLGGGQTLEEIRDLFEQRFAPRKLPINQLHSFLGMLHREGLVVSRARGQGEPLLQRKRKMGRQQVAQSLVSLLAIRFRGVDPEPVLAWLHTRVRFMYSQAAVAAGVAVILSAVLLVAMQFGAFYSRLPNFQAFFNVENVLLLGLVLAGCKVLHELAHGVTCKHFGGECHELGLMLLVFTPCLYCNVSDAWMVRSKWQRIAVSAAGIYVELLLAALCTFLWWFSQPGVFHSICLNVMFVCSVSTVLFNGNPLLRYDGYFILADLIETPNLRQQSQALLRQTALRWYTGIRSPQAWIFPTRDRWLIATYGVASLIYRWFVVGCILFVAYKVLRPYRLEVLAQLLALLVVAGALLTPIVQMVRLVKQPRQTGRVRPSRLLLAGLLSISGLVVIASLPLSRHVKAPVVIELADAVAIRTTASGHLADHVDVGQKVDAGDMLAQLSSPELDRQILQFQGQADVQRLYLRQLEQLQVRDTRGEPGGAGSQLLTARESLAATQRQLEHLLREKSRLRLTAPSAGHVFPPRARREWLAANELQTWQGTPLQPANVGCYLETDTMLCWIGRSNNLQAVVVVDQADMERIRVGQRVNILLDERYTRMLVGEVSEIARLEVDEVPPELAAKGQLATKPLDQVAKPMGVYYSVRVSLPPIESPPPVWSSGKAKIQVEPRSLGRVAYDVLCRTFRIEL